MKLVGDDMHHINPLDATYDPMAELQCDTVRTWIKLVEVQDWLCNVVSNKATEEALHGWRAQGVMAWHSGLKAFRRRPSANLFQHVVPLTTHAAPQLVEVCL